MNSKPRVSVWRLVFLLLALPVMLCWLVACGGVPPTKLPVVAAWTPTSALEANAHATIIAARATVAAAEAPTAVPSLSPLSTPQIATIMPPSAIGIASPPTTAKPKDETRPTGTVIAIVSPVQTELNSSTTPVGTARASAMATPTAQTQAGCTDLIAYVKDGALWLTDLAGRERRQVIKFGQGRSISHPYWLPDGQRLVFTDHENIYFVNVDGSGLTKMDYMLDWPTVSPDGKWIAGVFSLEKRVQSGVTTLTQDMTVMDLDGHNPRSLTGCTEVRPCTVNGSTWSPDGEWIAFGGSFGPSWRYDLYIVRSDGSQRRGLELTVKPPYHVSWSPDGTQIAFAGDYKLYLLAMDEFAPRRLEVLPGAEFPFVPSWSPDGKRLAVSAWFKPPAMIWVMNADGSNAVAITEGYDPAWRPCPSLRSP